MNIQMKKKAFEEFRNSEICISNMAFMDQKNTDQMTDDIAMLKEIVSENDDNKLKDFMLWYGMGVLVGAGVLKPEVSDNDVSYG